MLIGIDFDNTIAGYDHVFSAAAEREGLLPKGAATSKKGVRAALQAQPGGKEAWMRLQGRVYGAHMSDAKLIEGVETFLSECRDRGVGIYIVSHKTKLGHFDAERIDLRWAARKWMADKGFFDSDGFGLSEGNIYFEPTRDEKIERIRRLDLSHFIDDLAEVFQHPRFPKTTHRLLYSSSGKAETGDFRIFSNWSEICEELICQT